MCSFIFKLHHPITRISSTYGVSISRLSLLLLACFCSSDCKTIQLISLYPVWILSIYLHSAVRVIMLKGDSDHFIPLLRTSETLPALRIQCNLILWLSKPFTSWFYKYLLNLSFLSSQKICSLLCSTFPD